MPPQVWSPDVTVMQEPDIEQVQKRVLQEAHHYQRDVWVHLCIDLHQNIIDDYTNPLHCPLPA